MIVCACVCVQVYRSVLLRHTPREQVADENMEVDPASGGECKLTHQAFSFLDQIIEIMRWNLVHKIQVRHPLPPKQHILDLKHECVCREINEFGHYLF